MDIDTVGQEVEVIAFEDTFEHKFARDLMRYVVEKRMRGLHWVPTGIFAEQNLAENLDSPFTPQMKRAVNRKLDLYENYYHKQYDNNFPEENVTEEGHKLACRELAESFLNNEFSEKRFFTFCVLLAKYAGYSYLYGVTNAVEYAYKIVVRVLRHLKNKNIIDDGFWKEMQDFAEKPDLIDNITESSSDDSTVSASESEQHV